MKTIISITGQISGNRTILNAIDAFGKQIRNQPFNGYKIEFDTKKEAKKALWEAYKTLRSDKEDAQKSRLTYSKHGYLDYDASTAKIIDSE
jgi:hypothetical protein